MRRLDGSAPCDAFTDDGAHVGEICASAQLCSPATWSAKPVSASPSWEGYTWQGHRGVQSRPDHIFLSVYVSSPPATIDFRHSQILKRNVFGANCPCTIGFGRDDRLAVATLDHHFVMHFIEGARKWVHSLAWTLPPGMWKILDRFYPVSWWTMAIRLLLSFEGQVVAVRRW